MGRIEKIGRSIYIALEELYEACDVLHEHGCKGCPIASECLRDRPMFEVIEGLPQDCIEDFVRQAEKVNAYEGYDR